MSRVFSKSKIIKIKLGMINKNRIFGSVNNNEYSKRLQKRKKNVLIIKLTQGLLIQNI